MKKKILVEILKIVRYIAIMVLCIVALPDVEDFANQFYYKNTVCLFTTQCLAIIFVFWCPMMIQHSKNEIHEEIRFDKYKKIGEQESESQERVY